MFRSLQGTIKKKHQRLNLQHQTEVSLQQLLDVFVSDHFNGFNGKITPIFNVTTRTLTLITPHKIIASELVLQMENLTRYLKDQGLIVQKIVVK